MTNVSKKPIKQKTLSEINRQLRKIFRSFKNEKEAGLFVEEFFTDAEKTMFSKRLAILFMSQEGVPASVIERVLKVSPTTVKKISVILDRNGYTSIVKIITKRRMKEIFWSDLEKIFRAGLPKYGRGRWSFLKDLKKK